MDSGGMVENNNSVGGMIQDMQRHPTTTTQEKNQLIAVDDEVKGGVECSTIKKRCKYFPDVPSFHALVEARKRYTAFEKRPAVLEDGTKKEFVSLEQSRRNFVSQANLNREIIRIDMDALNELSVEIGMPGFTPDGTSFKINIKWIHKYAEELLKYGCKVPILYVAVKHVDEVEQSAVLMDCTGSITAKMDLALMSMLGNKLTVGTVIALVNVTVGIRSSAGLHLLIGFDNIVGLGVRIEVTEQEEREMNAIKTVRITEITDKNEDLITILRWKSIKAVETKNIVDLVHCKLLRIHTEANIPTPAANDGRRHRHVVIQSPLNATPTTRRTPLKIENEIPKMPLAILVKKVYNKRKTLVTKCKSSSIPLQKLMQIKKIEKKVCQAYDTSLNAAISSTQASSSSTYSTYITGQNSRNNNGRVRSYHVSRRLFR